MQQALGEIIRQARRQRNLTQTELGGDHFSKSYVSAVEREKIPPSPQALEFFATQLGCSREYFTLLLEQNEKMKQLSMQKGGSPFLIDEHASQDEGLSLLDILLESTQLSKVPPWRELPTLSPETIRTLPPMKQARYYFLLGLMAEEKHDLPAALHAFETALVLAPARYQAAILDELGVNYYLSKAYQTALGYHMRALQALENEPSSNGSIALQLKIELHCGDDYRALGAYAQARDHYERSRLFLSAEHDMKTAASLYLSLGYCTYAAMYQDAGRVHSCDMPERERQFQRAIGFLVQSRSIYQVSGNRVGEAIARLTQALVLLDLCTDQGQVVHGKSAKTGSISSIQCMSLLEEAEEQCRQVLLGWQEPPDIAPPEQDALLYTTLAYLIRMSIQRAAVARLDGHEDTAFRARAHAVQLCQQVLDTFLESLLPWIVLQDAGTLQAEKFVRQSLSLPQLPNQATPSDPFPRRPISQSEVYLAVAEVTEELGRVATKPEFACECYEHANKYMQAALDCTRTVTANRERDPGYFVRCYLRCAALLEERSLVASDMGEEIVPVLVEILKDGLSSLEDLILPVHSR